LAKENFDLEDDGGSTIIFFALDGVDVGVTGLVVGVDCCDVMTLLLLLLLLLLPHLSARNDSANVVGDM
jgi:hypothetical protein